MLGSEHWDFQLPQECHATPVEERPSFSCLCGKLGVKETSLQRLNESLESRTDSPVAKRKVAQMWYSKGKFNFKDC
jgi:hypothetical protein